MFRKLLILLIVMGFTFGISNAREGGPLGLGVIIGEPTGVSLKIWTSRTSAFDAAVAWSLDEDFSFHAHGDYLLHSYDLFNVEKGELPLYYGIGGVVKLRDDNGIGDANNDDLVGVRFPVGLNYLFNGVRLGIFLEVVPILELAPDTDFGFNGGLGMRYYF